MGKAEMMQLSQLLQAQNVGVLSNLLQGTHMIPEKFIIPETDRSHIPHNDFSAEVELPLIDMCRLDSSIPGAEEAVAEDIGCACRDWGFFQIVNHGISMDTIKRMESVAHNFYALPGSQKERGNVRPKQYGYDGRYLHLPSGVPWIESFTVNYSPACTVQELVDRIWPEGNQEFCDGIWEYYTAMEALGRRLVELLSISLGLERSTYTQHFEKSSASVRWNYYPPCPKPSHALGLHPHSDPNAMTILYQDNVGGLQICKDGKWIAVKPRPDSLIINVGDIFQAWTNGIYKSVEHRAVVNGAQPRLSMVFFYSPGEDVAIKTPEELIDDEHPLQYRPFTWKSYNAARRHIQAKGKHHIDVFAKIDPSQARKLCNPN